MLDRCNATVHGRVVLLATPDTGHYAMAQLLTACQLSTTTGALRPASHLSSSQTAVHRADHTHHCITTRITASALLAQPVPINATGRQLLSSIVINNTLLIEPVTQRGPRVAAVADCTSWGDECHTLARGVMVSRTLC